MAERTGIGWTDHTFNPWIGCTKISPACDFCYAESMAARYGWADWGDHPRHRTAEATWAQPLAWDRKAARDGVRRFVFCASLADVFDNQVDPKWRADLFALIRATPNLVWLLLTKRPSNIIEMARAAGDLPGNAALGCTVVTQQEVNRDVPHLLAAPTRMFRFVSVEPMLGPMDLTQWLVRGDAGLRQIDPLAAAMLSAGEADGLAWVRPALDWVICGGESGPSPRPIQIEWARALRQQCSEAGVPFFFKQWGGRTPKANGKMLDGREWCERPTVAPFAPALHLDCAR